MNTTLSPRSRRALDAVSVLARWFVGAAFIYMAVMKLRDPVQFLKLVRQYDMVTNPFLLNTIAATLPWYEMVCGVLLLAGVAVRGAALNVVAMLIPFTVLVLRRALGIAEAQNLPLCEVRFDCGCGTGIVAICQKVLENSTLLFLSLWLLAGYGRQLCLRFSLMSSASRNPAPVSAPSVTTECPG
jgi:uncharacterized membrane protein YphA (DoxX/SURF4 family)